jgi:hypothetical protein
MAQTGTEKKKTIERKITDDYDLEKMRTFRTRDLPIMN